MDKVISYVQILINKLIIYAQKLIEEFKKLGTWETAKEIDKRFMMTFFASLILLILTYYYYIVVVHPANKAADRQEAAKHLMQEQLAEQAKYSKKDNNIILPSNIPASMKGAYEVSYSIIDSFFKNLNNKDFQAAFKQLDTEFVETSNVTPESLANFAQSKYFNKNSFFIQDVQSVGNSYVVTVSVFNAETQSQTTEQKFIILKREAQLTLAIDDTDRNPSTVGQPDTQAPTISSPKAPTKISENQAYSSIKNKSQLKTYKPTYTSGYTYVVNLSNEASLIESTAVSSQKSVWYKKGDSHFHVFNGVVGDFEELEGQSFKTAGGKNGLLTPDGKIALWTEGSEETYYGIEVVGSPLPKGEMIKIINSMKAVN